MLGGWLEDCNVLLLLLLEVCSCLTATWHAQCCVLRSEEHRACMLHDRSKVRVGAGVEEHT